ncbi:hypothetical protein ACJJTC_008655 [Scirpophaga incertulas]
MANTAHLMRRQSSRDLYAQRSIDRMEMKELRGRLVTMENGHSSHRHVMYGATNEAFEDTSPNRRSETPTSKASSVEERPKPEGGECERESWDSKTHFPLSYSRIRCRVRQRLEVPLLSSEEWCGCGKARLGVWHQVSPYLGGIGISSAVVSFNVALYYNSIIAWCLFYFAQSFQAELPWSECPKKYFSNGSYITEPECAVSISFWFEVFLV